MRMEYTPSGPEEVAFLEAYDPEAYPGVSLTSDIILFTIKNGQLSVLLVERGDYPYKGAWALPGGFVNPSESAFEAAQRELLEETNMSTLPGHLEELRTYSTPGRDPRMRVISVAHVALMPVSETPIAGDDAAKARFWAIDDLNLDGTDPDSDAPVLAFDHTQIIQDALERVRAKIEYSPIATAFCDSTFTLSELRRVYETVWGVSLHASNFRRKIVKAKDFLVAADSEAKTPGKAGRPAKLYRKGEATLLHPAMLRPGVDGGRHDEEAEDGGLVTEKVALPVTKVTEDAKTSETSKVAETTTLVAETPARSPIGDEMFDTEARDSLEALSPELSVNKVNSRHIAAAKQMIEDNYRSGVHTPDWVVRISEASPREH